jgi:hypothetical protein
LSIKPDHKISFRILHKDKIFISLLQREKVAAKPTDEVLFLERALKLTLSRRLTVRIPDAQKV